MKIFAKSLQHGESMAPLRTECCSEVPGTVWTDINSYYELSYRFTFSVSFWSKSVLKMFGDFVVQSKVNGENSPSAVRL